MARSLPRKRSKNQALAAGFGRYEGFFLSLKLNFIT